jgi:chitin synthase
MLEQNLLLNRKNEMTDEYFVNQNKLAKDSCIFICTTMYHEADYEMEQLLHSIRRVDIARQESMRRIESHVWFDGAVKRNVLNR